MQEYNLNIVQDGIGQDGFFLEEKRWSSREKGARGGRRR